MTKIFGKQLDTTDKNLILNYLTEEPSDPALKAPTHLVNAFVDRYFDQSGIDLTHSKNNYFLQGSKKVVNDGIGGFNTVLYTGNSPSTQSITGLGFQPDFVWIKERSGTDSHFVYDSVRGPTRSLRTNSDGVETSDITTLTSFDSDGFTIGTDGRVNEIGQNYVSWNFECPTITSSWSGIGSNPDNEQYNLNIGMSIVRYTGTGTAHAINHNLGKAPQFMIVKGLDQVVNWSVYHQFLGGTTPGVQPERMVLRFNEIGGQITDSSQWNDTVPTSTTFTVGDAGNTNQGTQSHIAYLFTEIPGLSKFGSYEGNGSTNNITGLGFRPEMVIIKNIDTVSGWIIYDDTRDVEDHLRPDISDTEATVTDLNVRITADGFDLTGNATMTNLSGDTYIYAAFGKKGPANDIDLISNAINPSWQPTQASGFGIINPTDPVTLDTDLKLYISRVAGAESQLVTALDGSSKPYWIQAPLTKLSDIASSLDYVTGMADLSAQSPGTELRYRWVGANTKKMEIHSTYLNYR